MPEKPGRRGRRATGVGLILLPGLIAATIAGFASWRGVAAHVDEVPWIGSAYYFELLCRGDVRHPDWRLLPARESPPVGKYIFGLALRLTGRPVRTIDPLAGWYERWRELPGAWGAGEDVAERAALTARLGPEALAAIRQGRYQGIDDRAFRTTRAVAAGFGVACAIGVGLIGGACRGPIAGALAGTLFAVHPLAVEASTHALFDIIALTFSAFAVLGLIAAIRPGKSAGRRLAAGLGAGLMMGLAVGTKMNALIVVLVAISLLMSLAFAGSIGRLKGVGTTCAGLALAIVLAAILFVAVNPTLYPDVPRGLLDSLAVPARTTRVQAGFLPDFLATPVAKVDAAARLLCGRPEVFASLVAATLVVSWSGLRRLGPTTVVVAWWWLGLAAVVAWIPFPWPRYALPVLPPGALLLAIAAVDAAARIRGGALPRP